MILFAVTILLSAFLLFQIQPMIAKMILPWFGGSSAVWATCMVFFQFALLAGYLYAHWLREKLSPRAQAIVHSLLIAAAILVLPVIPSERWRVSVSGDPSQAILLLLAATVGLPYFLLSSTSPLLQSWYAGTHAGATPYRLFALSNLASMTALLSYPTLVEPNFTVRGQARAWSWLFGLFALLCAAAAWWHARRAATHSPAATLTAPPDTPNPTWREQLTWILLAAIPSTLLLAITTYLTQDVAAIPFLWILPLTVYLVSFIICFDAPRWYARGAYLSLVPLSLAFFCYLAWPDASTPRIAVVIGCALAALFVFCMTCHGELVRMKPPARHLTRFYVMLSVGGAVGGLFVGLIAPHLFNAYYELPIGLIACAVTLAWIVWRDYVKPVQERPLRLLATVALAASCIAAAWIFAHAEREAVTGYRVVTRNFYSQLRVADEPATETEPPIRKLLHGVINHGAQALEPPLKHQPITYFCPPSGIGRLMLKDEVPLPRRIGILGLGCGVLAAYGRPGDLIRIYELNPTVLELAKEEFTYLSDTPARVESVLGDGRLVLEQEEPQRFDILVMDAFSGDSVPVHLVTQEAFRIYQRHLKPHSGVLAVNVSNKYLDLRNVMERNAAAIGKLAVYFSHETEEDDQICFSNGWVLVMDYATYDRERQAFNAGEVLTRDPRFRPWTDDYSNMFAILK